MGARQERGRGDIPLATAASFLYFVTIRVTQAIAITVARHRIIFQSNFVSNVAGVGALQSPENRMLISCLHV
jgi:hypothetical protein